MTGTAERRESARPLKLRARDAEDIEALAVCLQDALVPLADMAYLPAEQRFVMVASRFCWECAAEDAETHRTSEPEVEQAGDALFEDADAEETPPFARVNCGVCFDRVRAVRRRGLDFREREQILNLLTMRAGKGHLDLVFSDGVEIRLEVSRISCHMEDLGEPWPTRWRPEHADGEPGA